MCNRLSSNLGKTKLMLIDPKNKHGGRKLNVSIANTQIEQVSMFKCLGIYIDDKLSWQAHVNHVISRISSNRYMFHCIKRSAPKSILKNLYYAHVYSYGLHIWGGNISEKQGSRIFKLKKVL